MIDGYRLLTVFALASGCAGHDYRFRDEPIVWKSGDDADIAEPEEIPYRPIPYMLDVVAFRQLTRALEIKTPTPAANVNALDEVPDSTWFQNRIGVRSMTPDEAAHGGATRGPAEPPLTIEKGKALGNNPGVWVRDARDRKYLLKFDLEGHPELHTAAEVLVARIMWAAGYHVPSDNIVTFKAEDLGLDPKATKTNDLGEKVPLTRADRDEIVRRATRHPDGTLRAMGSERLEGKPKGGFAAEGQRPDDPNDTIPHERRRELRAMRVISAWVNNTDVKPDQSLDMYVTEGGRRFLRHYVLDFSESLGGHQAQWGLNLHGHEYIWDWEEQGKALLTLGIYVRPWEKHKPTRWPSVGVFSAEDFDPSRWKETYPYWPFREMTPADAYWGAKLVMRFDRPILEAIVGAAQYSDKDAAAYVVDTLLARQKLIGVAWLAKGVTALDRFRVERSSICAVDLAVLYALAPPRIVEQLDDDGKVLHSASEDRFGRVCMHVPANDEYQRLRIRVRLGAEAQPPMQVHFRAGAQARVLGIVRTEN